MCCELSLLGFKSRDVCQLLNLGVLLLFHGLRLLRISDGNLFVDLVFRATMSRLVDCVVCFVLAPNLVPPPCFDMRPRDSSKLCVTLQALLVWKTQTDANWLTSGLFMK